MRAQCRIFSSHRFQGRQSLLWWAARGFHQQIDKCSPVGMKWNEIYWFFDNLKRTYSVRNIWRMIGDAAPWRHCHAAAIRNDSVVYRPNQILSFRLEPHALPVLFEPIRTATNVVLLHEINRPRVLLADCVILRESVGKREVHFFLYIPLVYVSDGADWELK